MTTGYIYALTDSHGTVRYIGQTARTPEDRYRDHRRAAKGGADNRVYRWMRKVGKTSVRTLETVEYDDIAFLNEREIYWVTFFRRLGADLTNMTDGGFGIQGFSTRDALLNYYATNPEARERNRQGQLKRYADPAERERAKQIAREFWSSPAGAATRARMSAAAAERGRERREQREAERLAAVEARLHDCSVCDTPTYTKYCGADCFAEGQARYVRDLYRAKAGLPVDPAAPTSKWGVTRGLHVTKHEDIAS